MQLTSIQQAARNALAAWLLEELAPVGGGAGVVIEPRWFEPERKLPERAISIIDAGPRRIEWTDPEQMIVTPSETGFVETVWGLGFIEQRIQLDVWARTDVELDDIMARLDRSLNAGLRAYGNTTNAEPYGIGLLLALGDGWAPGTVDFTFDEPHGDQRADFANQSEWHAMYRGDANMRLTQKSVNPKMARIGLAQRLTAGALGTGAVDTSILDIDTPADT